MSANETQKAIRSLLGQNLSQFKVVEMTEVYRVDEDGHRRLSLGYFRDSTLARAFAGNQVDKNWHQTHTVLVLTDGQMGFLLDTQEEVKLINEEEEAVRIREVAIAKLDPAERALLGF